MSEKAALIERTRKAFIGATTAKKFKAALRLAGRLRGKDQLVVLDALFAAADKLKVERTTGESLGMRQQMDGNVMVTWATSTRRPDGSMVRTTSTAVLEPVSEGPGWKSRQDVPEEIVEAVTAVAMADELKAPAKKSGKRIYIR